MSPRTPLQYREIREVKMALIMDTALEHFANEGYYITTINHIAKHAGISKGLMYNYFESKEALLMAIIHRSVNEIYNYFDIDRDGYLSESEFEYFIRKINVILREKRSFWRLLMQLLMQNEAWEELNKAFPVSETLIHPGHVPGDNQYPGQMMKMIREYFLRKKDRLGDNYDPEREIDMFLITLKGFAMTYVYNDKKDEIYYERLVDRIIELYK